MIIYNQTGLISGTDFCNFKNGGFSFLLAGVPNWSDSEKSGVVVNYTAMGYYNCMSSTMYISAYISINYTIPYSVPIFSVEIARGTFSSVTSGESIPVISGQISPTNFGSNGTLYQNVKIGAWQNNSGILNLISPCTISGSFAVSDIYYQTLGGRALLNVGRVRYSDVSCVGSRKYILESVALDSGTLLYESKVYCKNSGVSYIEPTSRSLIISTGIKFESYSCSGSDVMVSINYVPKC
jgi:hypothetical protein